jgi:hypothetical protein
MTCFDEASTTSGYARYLAAKTTVDDRALNRQVLAELGRLMPAGAPPVAARLGGRAGCAQRPAAGWPAGG